MNLFFDEQLGHLGEFVLRRHRDDRPACVSFDSLAGLIGARLVSAHQIGAGDDAHQVTVAVGHDKSADVFIRHALRRIQERGAGVAAKNAIAFGLEHGEVLHVSLPDRMHWQDSDESIAVGKGGVNWNLTLSS